MLQNCFICYFVITNALTRVSTFEVFSKIPGGLFMCGCQRFLEFSEICEILSAGRQKLELLILTNFFNFIQWCFCWPTRYFYKLIFDKCFSWKCHFYFSHSFHARNSRLGVKVCPHTLLLNHIQMMAWCQRQVKTLGQMPKHGLLELQRDGNSSVVEISVY